MSSIAAHYFYFFLLIVTEASDIVLEIMKDCLQPTSRLNGDSRMKAQAAFLRLPRVVV